MHKADLSKSIGSFVTLLPFDYFSAKISIVLEYSGREVVDDY